MAHRPKARSALLAVGATMLASVILTTARPAGAGSASDVPRTTLPVTTSSSLPCVYVWSTDPPAWVEVCPPI
jgi:hypothetical protein